MSDGEELQGSGHYSIYIEEEVQKDLFSLGKTHEAAFLEATEMLHGHISTTPKQWIPGRLKSLKGKYKGLYQLRLGGGNRLIYSVDDEEMVVKVEYVGNHPEWDKSRPGGRL
jgi:mRNA-degrading endonuclease RelE of RelBE toxin-antitoxin system